MGKRGDKLTADATQRADQLVESLAQLGDVTSKKMFGGYGIFESGLMFALVQSDGMPCLRVAKAGEEKFTGAGSRKHDRMPYWSIPDKVLDDDANLIDWATDALDAARAAKR